MSSNIKPKTPSAKESPTEPFKRAVTGCVRAIARKHDLEVSFAAERPDWAFPVTDKVQPPSTDDGKPKTAHYTRVRADGGIFTADEAVQYGLVDAVGTLEDAIAEAAREAGLTKYRAVTYERPLTLLGLLGADARAATPRPHAAARGLRRSARRKHPADG